MLVIVPSLQLCTLTACLGVEAHAPVTRSQRGQRHAPRGGGAALVETAKSSAQVAPTGGQYLDVDANETASSTATSSSAVVNASVSLPTGSRSTPVKGVNFIQVADTSGGTSSSSAAIPSPPSLTSSPTAVSSNAPVGAGGGAPTSQTTREGTGTLVPQETVDQWIATHNQARKAYGANDLTWDNSLVPAARANAAWCNGTHTPNPPRTTGENIYSQSGSADPQEAIDYWVGEAAFYDWTTQASKNGSEVLHFTQVVWQKTRTFACWISQCEPGTLFPARYGVAYESTCEYSPPGNDLVPGQFASNVGTLIPGAKPTSA